MDKPFVLGADISWMPQMLADGFVFRDFDGRPAPLLNTLRTLGFNTIRLRTWVNPSEDRYAGHCSAQETVVLARECLDAGFRFMLDFHYSDTWADPRHQRKPAAWEGLSFNALEAQVYRYTRDVMTQMKEACAAPEWVQIGNEINPGMLLPDGSTEDFSKLSRLVTAGHRGVKDVCPGATTIVHLADFNITDFILHFFDALDQHACYYDMMGFSYYPYGLPDLPRETCFEGYRRSMREIPARFGKDFMIVETGEQAKEEALTERFLQDQLAVIAEQSACKGLMLWEPEAAACWSHYPLSAWRDDGTPSPALRALKAALSKCGLLQKKRRSTT